jgi:hypothetical protein
MVGQWGSVAENDARRMAAMAAREQRLTNRNAVDAAEGARAVVYTQFALKRCLETNSEFTRVSPDGNCLFLVLFLCWQHLQRIKPDGPSLVNYVALMNKVCFQSGMFVTLLIIPYSWRTS